METENIARPEWVKRELKLARASIEEVLEELCKNGNNSDIIFWIENAKIKLNSALIGVKK